MQRTAEAVSLGHPDKIADYISSFLLDRLTEQDKNVKYAVEILIKGNTVVLGGEVTGDISLKPLKTFVLQALADIGYTESYARRWGSFAIEPNRIHVIDLIGRQSSEIYQGVARNGWGDQGVFVGYACQGPGHIDRALELARRLNRALYDRALTSDCLGLNIKTQVTLDTHNELDTVIAAVPMLKKTELKDFIVQTLGQIPRRLIVNGTGVYQTHASIADCGVTGRKLACDFYGTAAPIGGGSPWTKDPSKADLTLNLYARKLALKHLKDNEACFVYLSSCIGRADLPSAVVKTVKNGVTSFFPLCVTATPTDLIAELGLNRPIFAQLCKNGLFSLEKESS